MSKSRREMGVWMRRSSGPAVLAVLHTLTASAWGEAPSPSSGTATPPSARAFGSSDESETGQAEVPISDLAKQHFAAGVNLLQDPDGARYEEAYIEFKAAYAESPSWKILGNLALSAMKLERDGEAIDAYTKYLAEGGDEVQADERSQVEADLTTLRTSTATVTLRLPTGGSAVLDERRTHRGEQLINRYEVNSSVELVLRVRPGTHRFQLTGVSSDPWDVTLSPGARVEHTFSTAVAPADAPRAVSVAPKETAGSRPIPAGVFVGLSVTGALVIGGSVVGGLALAKGSEFNAANERGSSDAGALRDDLQTLNLTSDLLFGGAIVAGVVTTVLFVTRPKVTPKETAQWAPVAGPDRLGLVVRGSF